MIKPNLTRSALALAVVAVLSACGGGESSTQTASQTFADALATQTAVPSDRLRALAVSRGEDSTAGAAAVITNAQLFQGAEAIFPDLFPTTTAPVAIPNVPYEGKVFQVRQYASGNFLGVASDGNVYVLGPYTGWVLVNVGAMQGFADLVCSRINCGGGGGSTGPVGPLNSCTEGASVALQTGRRFNAVYISNMLVAPVSTGEYSIEGVVNGASSFEGQSAVKMTTTTRGTQFGQTVDATVLSYHKAHDFDLTRTLGTEITGSFSGFTSTVKAVWTAPASLNNEFTLAVGGTMSKTEELTSTTVVTGLPFPMDPVKSTTTTTYTYERNENVTVPAGSFNTCRYKMVTEGSAGYTTMWVINGRGVSAKMENVNGAGVVEYRAELKSASINGGSL
jgi:hypothetical protein